MHIVFDEYDNKSVLIILLYIWTIGSIPSTIGSLADLRSMSIELNSINGVLCNFLYSPRTFPIVRCAVISPVKCHIVIEHTTMINIVGSLPQEIGSLTKLIYLLVDYTSISGTNGYIQCHITVGPLPLNFVYVV